MATTQDADLHAAHLRAGRLGEARLELLEQRRGWHDLSDQRVIAEWFASMAWLDYLRGCFGSAMKDAGYARRLGDGHAAGLALRVIGCVQLERGFEEVAIQSLSECLELATGDTWAAAAADLGLARGDLGLLTTALEAGNGSGSSAWAAAKLARGLCRAGQPTEAAQVLERAREALSAGEGGFGWIQSGLAEAELSLATSRPGTALESVERLLQRLDREGVRSHLGEAMLLKVDALHGLGRGPEASTTAAAIRELALGLGAGRLLAMLE